MDKQTIEVGSMDRKSRRAMGRFSGVKIKGVQDSKESTLKTYWIPLKRKSRAGVEYIYYKKVVDKIGLDKKNDKDK